ncbi:MAG: hypothetical protein IPP77_04860 [Bacteroidetes bacterium]|nr:hypothetical protein [Bacteroidota bacterium]
MIITEEKIDKLHTRVKVNLKKEDYEPQIKKQIKALTKQVDIKGFRPGMVPIEIVKKKYGNSVFYEEIDKQLREVIENYIRDNQIHTLVSPIPAPNQSLHLDVNEMKDIDFEYDVSISPEIDLSYIENSPSFTKYKILPDEKMIDDEVMRIRTRFATYEYPEVVGETDILTFTVEELDEQGNLKPGGINTTTTVMTDLLTEDAKSKIILLKKQESIVYNAFELMDRDRESMAKNVLNINDLSKLSEVGDSFKLTLNNISRSKPAELNEEFYLKVYGEDGIKSEAEMREQIKGDLEAYLDGSSDKILVNDLYKGMMEHVEFPLPDDYLLRWLDVTNDQENVTREQIEKEYPDFAKSLRWQLMQGKIIKEQGLNITPEEVADRVRTNLIHRLYGYGMSNMGDEWVEQFVQKQLSDKKVVSQTRDELIEAKVIDFIKGKSVLTTKEITFSEFRDMMDKEQ